MTLDEMINELIALQKLGYGDKDVYVQDSEHGSLVVDSVTLYDTDVYIDA